ncbi:hypothetical protein JA1_000287 [Spathaspora sp. JA1]|nr:hypothetical protein JA1_000287 [Spathaspora sp. JA1]
MASKLSGVLFLTLVAFISLLYTNNLQLPFLSTFTNSNITDSIPSTVDNMSGDLKSYIFTLKDDISELDLDSVKSLVGKLGGEITNEFSLIKGFAAKLPAVDISALHSDDRIANIEEDKEVHIV